MNKLDDLHTLERLLKEFEFPVSPILEYAIKEKEEELCATYRINEDSSHVERSTIDIVGNPISNESLKEKFNNYLYKVKSERTARNYLYYIEKPIRIYINKVVDSCADSVYSCKTAAEVISLMSKLKNDESFLIDNQKWHNALTAALSSYLKFLESKEKL